MARPLCCFVGTIKHVSFHCFPLKLCPPFPKNVFVLNGMHGNSDFKIPREFIFVRDITLKGKIQLVFSA